jgi:hypothetical protein
MLSIRILDANIMLNLNTGYKNSLKIPKGLSEALNQRRADNTMAKRTRPNNDLRNTKQKTKNGAK